jgi:hypothetical protein
VVLLHELKLKKEPQDTIKGGFSLGKLQIKNPQSVLSAYTYDPVMDRYVYTNTVDGFSINYPNFDSKSNDWF